MNYAKRPGEGRIAYCTRSVTAAATAMAFTEVCLSPFYTVAARMHVQKTTSGEKSLYDGMLGTFTKAVQKEGPKVLFSDIAYTLRLPLVYG